MQALVDELKARTEKIKLGRSDGRRIDAVVTFNEFSTVGVGCFSPLPALVKPLCLQLKISLLTSEGTSLIQQWEPSTLCLLPAEASPQALSGLRGVSLQFV